MYRVKKKVKAAENKFQRRERKMLDRVHNSVYLYNMEMVMTTAELSKQTGISEQSLTSLCKLYAMYMADGMTLEQAMERTHHVLSVICDHAKRNTEGWREFSRQMAEDTYNTIRKGVARA